MLPWGGSLELGALGGWGEGRVKVLMGGAAHTCRGSLASPPKSPPGANFYQRETLGQGVGTQRLPTHSMGLSRRGMAWGGQEMLWGGPQEEFRGHQSHEGAASWTPTPQASLTLSPDPVKALLMSED